MNDQDDDWHRELTGLLLDNKIRQEDYDRISRLPRTFAEWMSDCMMFTAKGTVPDSWRDFSRPPFTDPADIFALYSGALVEKDRYETRFGDLADAVESSDAYRLATLPELVLFAREKFEWRSNIRPIAIQGDMVFWLQCDECGSRIIGSCFLDRTMHFTVKDSGVNSRLLVVRK